MFDTSPPISPLEPDAVPPRPLTITELTGKIKRLLETQIANLLVEGEVSGYKEAGSGHIYFDLKDSGALIHCVVWSADAARLRYRPTDGAKIEATGRLTVYDQRGQYQLRITAMRPAGLGKLYQAFIEMKERLATEGLFAPENKKPLPSHPRRIGLVTSPTGAAIRDMLNILTRRAPHIHVLIWPARVQGEGAAREIAHAINRFNALKEKVDVLIVGRGGGSLEDLWAFNEEVVARAIFQSAIPIISAVGHETDTTIADFVADLRAPTPSAAAELVARDSGELLRNLAILQNRALRAMREHSSFLRQAPHLATRLEASVIPRLTALRSQLKEFERSYGIQLPLQRVNQAKQHHDDILDRMKRNLVDRMKSRTLQSQRLTSHLGALNPKAILKRGYSITYNTKTARILTTADKVKPGTPIRIILGEGQLNAHTDGADATPQKSPRAKKRNIPTAIDWFGLDSDDTK